MIIHKALIILSVLIVELAITYTLRHIDGKPDIVRILYEDIPLVYSIGLQITYALFVSNVMQLAGHIPCHHTGQYFIMVWIIHIVFKMIIRLWSPIIANRFDYFHLLKRYTETYTFIQHIGIDTIYLWFVVMLYSLFNLSTKHHFVRDVPLSLLLSILGYGIISLTFEDV